MHKLLFILLLFYPGAVIAQTQNDYAQAMTLFMKYYNEGNTNKICQMFRPVFRANGCTAFQENPVEYGDMVSREFVGIDIMPKYDDTVRIFKVMYSSRCHGHELPAQ